jgi:hypothetical protein
LGSVRTHAQLQSGAAPIDDSAAQAALPRFTALTEAAKASGDMPRIADPAVRVVLDAIWDVRPLDPGRRATVADLPVLVRFCEAGGKVWQTYFQFSSRGTGNPDLEANMSRFADEIMPGLAFSVRCSGATLEAAVAFLGSLPADQMNQARRDGWNRMRAGTVQVIQGTLTTLGDASVAPGHVERLARALNDSAPRFAAGLEPTERQAVVALTRAALTKVTQPIAKSSLEAFATTLGGQ